MKGNDTKFSLNFWFIFNFTFCFQKKTSSPFSIMVDGINHDTDEGTRSLAPSKTWPVHFSNRTFNKTHFANLFVSKKGEV